MKTSVQSLNRIAQWRKNNPDKVRAASSKYNKRKYAEDPEIYRLTQRFLRAINPEKYRLTWRKCHFKTKYGLTIEQRDEIIRKQNNLCALCSRQGNGKKRSLFIDHCHVTKKVRGALCGLCNAFLARVESDPEYIARMKLYLNQ